MSGKSRLRCVVIVFLCLGFIASIPWFVLRRAGATTTSNSSPSAYAIPLVPDQLFLALDYATITNTVGHCTEPWLSSVPSGTIILGVDPTSCDPADWDGGSATAEVFLQDVYSPTVLVLELSWPDGEGRGLHSPDRNQTGTITLDGRPLWGKRTTHLGTSTDLYYGDTSHYYAAEHGAILTTIVVTQSVTHTLTISVPAQTAWDLSRVELTAYPYTTTIRGIGYSPLRDCQYPGGDSQPSTQDIEEDLFRLFHTSNAIRTYSARGVNGQIPALANAIGLPVFAGAWIDGDPETTSAEDDAEIQALIDLACSTDLEGVIVGNEYYLRHRTGKAIGYLQGRIVEVSDGIKQCGKDVPITTAEIDNLMFGWESNSSAVITGTQSVYEPILKEVDFIMVHTYPFWNAMSIDGAASFTVRRYKAIQALIKQKYSEQNKWVVIGETGWPSAGRSRGSAFPSMWNQQRYMLEFLTLAEQEDVDFLYFDAFDELWKTEEPGGVGRHWGYSYADRMAKHSFYGVLLPAERLPPFIPLQKVYLPYVSGGSGQVEQPFYVYTEWLEETNHFVPSGWMGDIDSIDMYGCDRSNPHSGEMALRVSFAPTGTLGWAGVYWQEPEDNWGNLSGGYDLTGARRLTFWIRGEQGGEVVEFFVGGLGEQYDPYRDTIQPKRSTGDIVLSDTWQQVEISLDGAKLNRVIGGFGWAASRCHNSEPIIFYIDDVAFDFNSAPGFLPRPTRRPFYVYDDNDSVCNHFVPSGWMGDTANISLDQAWTDNPHGGATAIRNIYSGHSWAGVYWQEPENNWGDRLGGFDLTGADRLTFWARSDTPNTRVKFLIGGIGYPNGTACWNPSEPYPDSVCPKIEETKTLYSTWTRYTIDLPQSRDLSGVVGGFGWVADKEVTFYLDDIVYEFD